jgi:hypothetical protein
MGFREALPMSWFKVDDGFAFHQKTVEAGNSAIGLWLRAGSWSSQLGTEGYVPASIRNNLGTKRDAERLVETGLWLPADGGGGFIFHDWDEYQPTKAGSEERRKIRAEAGRRGGLASGRSRRLKAVGGGSNEASASDG